MQNSKAIAVETINAQTNTFEAIANHVRKTEKAKRVCDFKDITDLRNNSGCLKDFARIFPTDSFYHYQRPPAFARKMEDFEDGFVGFAVQTLQNIDAKYLDIIELKMKNDGAGFRECTQMTIDFTQNIIKDDFDMYHKPTMVIALIAHINFSQNNPDYSEFFKSNKPMLTKTKAIYDNFIRIFTVKNGLPTTNPF